MDVCTLPVPFRLHSLVQLRRSLKEKLAALVQKAEGTAVGIRHSDHVAHSNLQNVSLISSTNGGRSVGIVR
jgi:biopolymer transport protein ExbD